MKVIRKTGLVNPCCKVTGKNEKTDTLCNLFEFHASIDNIFRLMWFDKMHLYTKRFSLFSFANSNSRSIIPVDMEILKKRPFSGSIENHVDNIL